MKQVWRFIKWSFSGMTFRTWTLVMFFFFAGGSITAGPELQPYMWGGCVVIAAYWWLDLFIDVMKSQWKKFREHDEEIFNILKKEKIDG